MVNIYKGLKRRGGKKKLLKIGILGLKFKFFVMLFLNIFCIIWKKNLFLFKRKKIYEKMERKKINVIYENFVGFDIYLIFI